MKKKVNKISSKTNFHQELTKLIENLTLKPEKTKKKQKGFETFDLKGVSSFIKTNKPKNILGKKKNEPQPNFLFF